MRKISRAEDEKGEQNSSGAREAEQEMMRERRSIEEQGEQNRRGEERASESRTLFKSRNSRRVDEQGEQKTGRPGSRTAD